MRLTYAEHVVDLGGERNSDHDNSDDSLPHVGSLVLFQQRTVEITAIQIFLQVYI